MPLFLPLDVLFLDATHGALTAETALTAFNPVSRLACETYTFEGKRRAADSKGQEKTQMCDGARGDGGEADHQDVVPSGLGEASESVPGHLCQEWASLRRRERQRSRRRFFRAQAMCCSRPVLTEKLSSIDARVKILEEALAEFLHATAASIPVPPTRSARERGRADAAPLSSPAPANTDGETLPDVPQAAEVARNAVPPSPTTADSTSAAVPHAHHCRPLHGAALHSAESLDDTPHSAALHGATSLGAASVPSGTVTGALQLRSPLAWSSTCDRTLHCCRKAVEPLSKTWQRPPQGGHIDTCSISELLQQQWCVPDARPRKVVADCPAQLTFSQRVDQKPAIHQSRALHHTSPEGCQLSHNVTHDALPALVLTECCVADQLHLRPPSDPSPAQAGGITPPESRHTS